MSELTPRPIKRLLIANRGEIAVRVMRACKDLGITAIAVYSDCDKTAYHVRMADEAYHLGPSPAAQSYLNQDKLIEVARAARADAIHPGYGFVSENAGFAKRCAEAGIIFIGPPPDTIHALGDKIEARRMAIDAGLPVVPGIEFASVDVTSAATLDAASAFAKKVGYPVLIKAAAGGGGKGMRVVDSADQFAESLQRASSEAKSAFGDGRVFVEKYLLQPRHIEFQILCDTHGNAVHLNERECSIQRRHQKVIEETPSPIMIPELRARMGAAAVSIARKAGYVSAGTVEFLVDKDRNFYFLEVNTRLQVEHPITEMITGIDLVHQQIAIAEGAPLPFTQEQIGITGHALELRIYAEDPDDNFAPSTGTLSHYRIPAGPGVRVDAGVVILSEIPIYYDPMIAKLVIRGATREEAIMRARRALMEYRIAGVKTTIGFHLTVLNNPRFLAGDISTKFLLEEYPENRYHQPDDDLCERAAIAAALDRYLQQQRVQLTADSRSQETPPTERASTWASFGRRAGLRNFGGASS